ncbi:TonB family protein [Archangium violaceum]|uniref:energy transducer TonB n=1 Tax=Archangium violaceum TaxID=83451 RepID=UPI0037C03D91
MRMILNFHVGMDGRETVAAEDRSPAVSLFRMGEPPRGESERWGAALLIAALVHVGVALVWLAVPGTALQPPAPPEEPELVFFSFPPPPPPAAGSATPRAAQPQPERVQRQARPRPARPAVVPTLPMPVPTPVEAPPVEAANPETVPETVDEAPVADEAPGVAGGTEGVGGVVAGIVGGVIGGREGGMVGATGGSALDLTQVARPPQVLQQLKPTYPRRAKADGIEGLVMVRVIIGTDGRIEPEHTQVIRSVPALDAAAISAVSQWRFSPAIGKQGRPVRVIVEIPVQFSLK